MAEVVLSDARECMPGPSQIWLSPLCNEESDEGRLWSAEPIGACEECGQFDVRYIRADDYDDLVAALRKARTKVYNAAVATGTDPEFADLACSDIDAALSKAGVK